MHQRKPAIVAPCQFWHWPYFQPGCAFCAQAEFIAPNQWIGLWQGNWPGMLISAAAVLIKRFYWLAAYRLEFAAKCHAGCDEFGRADRLAIRCIKNQCSDNPPETGCTIVRGCRTDHFQCRAGRGSAHGWIYFRQYFLSESNCLRYAALECIK